MCFLAEQIYCFSFFLYFYSRCNLKVYIMAKNHSLKTFLKQLFVFVSVFTGVVFCGHYFYSQIGGKVSNLLLDHAWDSALQSDRGGAHPFKANNTKKDKAHKKQARKVPQTSDQEYSPKSTRKHSRNHSRNHSGDVILNDQTKLASEQLREAVSSLVSSEQNSAFLNNIAAGSIISITNVDGKTVWFRIVRKKTSEDLENCADLDAPKKDTTLVKCMSFRTASMPSQEYVLEPIKGTFVSGPVNRSKAPKQDNNRL